MQTNSRTTFAEKIVECRGNVQDYTAPQKEHMRESSTTVAALAANFNGHRTQLLMYNGLPGHGLQHFITEKDSEAVAKSAAVSCTSKLLIWNVKHIYEPRLPCNTSSKFSLAIRIPKIRTNTFDLCRSTWQPRTTNLWPNSTPSWRRSLQKCASQQATTPVTPTQCVSNLAFRSKVGTWTMHRALCCTQ